MTLSFNQRVRVPEDVLVRELDGESVLLNLATSAYFGLDGIGTDMWRALTASDSIQAACEVVLAEYDVSPETLQRDMQELVEKLVGHGLLQLAES
jgi:hypothetical protein